MTVPDYSKFEEHYHCAQCHMRVWQPVVIKFMHPDLDIQSSLGCPRCGMLVFIQRVPKSMEAK